MDFINNDLILRIKQLTWRNPAFMAIFIASIWLVPQIMIRKIISNNIRKRKLEKQKEKINKLYPKSPK